MYFENMIKTWDGPACVRQLCLICANSSYALSKLKLTFICPLSCPFAFLSKHNSGTNVALDYIRQKICFYSCCCCLFVCFFFVVVFLFVFLFCFLFFLFYQYFLAHRYMLVSDFRSMFSNGTITVILYIE